MVAVQIGLALSAVDDELIHLADTAADLEGSGEHCAAHADHAGLADTLKDGLGVFQLLFGEGGQILAGGVLIVVLDNDGHDHVSQGVGSGFYRHYLAGNGGMNRGGDRRRILTDLLTHFYIVADLNKRLAGSAYVLCHGDDYLRRRSNYRNGDLGCFHVIGVYAAFKSMGHKLHLVFFCKEYHITSGHKLSTFKGWKTGILKR